MIGSRYRFTLGPLDLALHIPGLAALAITCTILVAHELPENTAIALIALGSASVLAAFLLVMLALDLLPMSLTRQGRLIGPESMSASGASGLWHFESEEAERRNAIVGYGAAVLVALVSALAVTQSHDRAGTAAPLVFVLALLILGASAIRCCPIRPFPGGFAARRAFGILASDEDGVATGSTVMSYLSSAVLAMAGFSIMANPGSWGPWGMALLVASIDCAVLTHASSLRVRWMNKASERTLESIRYSRLPTVSHAAPVSELFSIFAVEGSRATVVVTDDDGQACGLIQLRHLRRAARTGASVHPDELMVTLTDIPEFACDARILDAAIALERSGAGALVTKCGNGKRRVISLEELLRLGDATDQG